MLKKVVMFQDKLDFTSLVSHQSDSWGYNIHARKRLSAQKTASANELMNRWRKLLFPITVPTRRALCSPMTSEDSGRNTNTTLTQFMHHAGVPYINNHFEPQNVIELVFNWFTIGASCSCIWNANRHEMYYFEEKFTAQVIREKISSEM